jgi:hypothetical protein
LLTPSVENKGHGQAGQAAEQHHRAAECVGHEGNAEGGGPVAGLHHEYPHHLGAVKKHEAFAHQHQVADHADVAAQPRPLPEKYQYYRREQVGNDG